MTLLLHGDCLEHMKTLTDDSIDLIFCDLPYGQTSCKWDCLVDLDEFWKQVMRIKKLNTPIFFTCTTKFGVSLINSAPKKIPFRYDIIWVKSAPTGFLCAKKMPMRKHEMIYVFYEKLPFYDLSSHKHKFIKEVNEIQKKDYNVDSDSKLYGEVKRNDFKERKNSESRYNPPLPTSIVKEENNNHIKDGQIYNGGKGMNVLSDGKGHQYDPPLPTSIIKQNEYNHNEEQIYNADYLENKVDFKGRKGGSMFEPPLPTSMLEIKSTKGKHSTEKPVALMEWILKYYSKEGDVVLDPTMGSGSTGISCKNMKRNFIGIEMDDDIFEVAYKRLNEDE